MRMRRNAPPCASKSTGSVARAAELVLNGGVEWQTVHRLKRCNMAFVRECGYQVEFAADQRQRLAVTGGRITTAIKAALFGKWKQQLPLLISLLALLVSVASYFRSPPRKIEADSILVGTRNGAYVAITTENGKASVEAGKDDRRAVLEITEESAGLLAKVGPDMSTLFTSPEGPSLTLSRDEDRLMTYVTKFSTALVTGQGKEMKQRQVHIVRAFR